MAEFTTPNFVYVKYCLDCIHKDVCKHKEKYEQTAHQIDEYLNKIEGVEIDRHIIQVSVKCLLYSGGVFQPGDIPINPFNDNWISTNPNPIRYSDGTGDSPNLEKYEITC